MKDNLKKISIASLLFILLTALIYISDIANLPNHLVLFEGEALNLKTVFGVDVKTVFSSNPNIEGIDNYETITVSADATDNDYTGKVNLEVSLFGIKFKEISVDIIKNAEVVPLGNLIGLKLYTSGVLVVGMSEITGIDDEKYKPYENSGIIEGDIIVEVDKKKVSCTNELTECIDAAEGKDMLITYIREGKTIDTMLKAVKSEDNSYKIGLWVRQQPELGLQHFMNQKVKSLQVLGME